MKDCLLKLTLAVYRVTDKFPEKEPLKYFIREAAGRIFSFTVAPHIYERSQLDCELERLKDYFFIAKSQNWVAEVNFLVLEKEYDKIKEIFSAQSSILGPQKFKKLAKLATTENPPQHLLEQHLLELNSNRYAFGRAKRDMREHRILSPLERKQKIAKVIKEREQMAFAELVSYFPQISKRTLIRDLQNLLKEEKIRKQGNGKGVIYMPNGRELATN